MFCGGEYSTTPSGLVRLLAITSLLENLVILRGMVTSRGTNSLDSKIWVSTMSPVRGLRNEMLPSTPFSMSPLCVRKTPMFISRGISSGNRSSRRLRKVQIAAAGLPPWMKLR